MADLHIKMGVNAPAEDVNGVLKVLDYISKFPPEVDRPIRMKAYAEDLSDGAIGVLASMSIVIEFNTMSGQKKTVAEHVIHSFIHIIVDEQPAYEITVTPLAKKLIKLVYAQREYESDESKRAAFIQMQAEELGL